MRQRQPSGLRTGSRRTRSTVIAECCQTTSGASSHVTWHRTCAQASKAAPSSVAPLSIFSATRSESKCSQVAHYLRAASRQEPYCLSSTSRGYFPTHQVIINICHPFYGDRKDALPPSILQNTKADQLR